MQENQTITTSKWLHPVAFSLSVSIQVIFIIAGFYLYQFAKTLSTPYFKTTVEYVAEVMEQNTVNQLIPMIVMFFITMAMVFAFELCLAKCLSRLPVFRVVTTQEPPEHDQNNQPVIRDARTIHLNWHNPYEFNRQSLSAPVLTEHARLITASQIDYDAVGIVDAQSKYKYKGI